MHLESSRRIRLDGGWRKTMIPISLMRTALVAALLSLAVLGPASAHSIWLEPEGDGARIYFGEFDENLREASPGLLDRLNPQAKVAGSEKPLKVERAGGSFVLTGAVAKGDSLVAEDVKINERR